MSGHTAGATNAQKTPLIQSLSNIARVGAGNKTQQLGKVLPCSVIAVSGSIVTVKFELETGVFTLQPMPMPVMGPEYIRYPLQVGDKGIAVAADAYIGHMSGLGTQATGDLSPVPNLSSLVFMPTGNKNFSPVDGNKIVLYGPNGAILSAKDDSVHIDVDKTSGTITIKGDLHVSGTVIAGFGTGDQVGLQTHRHGTGTAAAGTSVPTPGT